MKDETQLSKEKEMIKKIQLYQCENSFNDLLSIYRAFIYKIIYKICYDNHERVQYLDDLVQEGYIGLYKAAIRFDLDKDVKFSSYVYVVVKRRIIYYYFKQYKYNKLRNYEFSQMIQENDGYYSINSTSRTPESIFIENVENNKFIKAYNELDEIDKTVLKLVLKKVSYKEIAEKTGLGLRQIDYRAYKARKKLYNSCCDDDDNDENGLDMSEEKYSA